MSEKAQLPDLLREVADDAERHGLPSAAGLMREAATKLEGVDAACSALLRTWDDSADVLGPEWNGLAGRIEALRTATAVSSAENNEGA